MNDNFDQLSFDASPPNWSTFHQKGRVKAIARACDMMTRANRSEGIRHMSDTNPKAAVIDAEYSVGVDDQSYMAGRDAIIERANRLREIAIGKWATACSLCENRGCELRDNFPEIEDKYHYVKDRKALLKRLVEDPKTPC